MTENASLKEQHTEEYEALQKKYKQAVDKNKEMQRQLEDAQHSGKRMQQSVTKRRKQEDQLRSVCGTPPCGAAWDTVSRGECCVRCVHCVVCAGMIAVVVCLFTTGVFIIVFARQWCVPVSVCCGLGVMMCYCFCVEMMFSQLCLSSMFVLPTMCMYNSYVNSCVHVLTAVIVYNLCVNSCVRV